MKKFEIIFYFGIFTVVRSEEFSNFTFLCVNNDCSEPIKSMKSRIHYDPDHSLKISVRKDDVVPIHGVSNDTKLMLSKNPFHEGPFLVPSHILVNNKLQQKEHLAKVPVQVRLPKKFANNNQKLQPIKNHVSSSVEKRKGVVKSDVKLKMFLRVVLTNFMSFFENETDVDTATAAVTSSSSPRVVHGESPYRKTQNTDNSTEGVTVSTGEEEVLNFFNKLSGVEADDPTNSSETTLPQETLNVISKNQMQNDPTMELKTKTTIPEYVTSNDVETNTKSPTESDSVASGAKSTATFVNPATETGEAKILGNVNNCSPTLLEPQTSAVDKAKAPRAVNINVEESKTDPQTSKVPTANANLSDVLDSKATASDTTVINDTDSEPKIKSIVVDRGTGAQTSSFNDAAVPEIVNTPHAGGNVDITKRLQPSTLNDSAVPEVVNNNVDTATKPHVSSISEAPVPRTVNTNDDTTMKSQTTTYSEATVLKVENAKVEPAKPDIVNGSVNTPERPKLGTLNDVSVPEVVNKNVDTVSKPQVSSVNEAAVLNTNPDTATKPQTTIFNEATISKVENIKVDPVDEAAISAVVNEDVYNETDSTVTDSTIGDSVKSTLQESAAGASVQSQTVATDEKEEAKIPKEESPRLSADRTEQILETPKAEVLKPKLENVSQVSDPMAHSDTENRVTPGPDESVPIPFDSTYLDHQPLADVETNTKNNEQPVKLESTDISMVNEKHFYTVAVEYLSTIFVINPNFNEWFSTNEVKNESCSSELDCDGVIVHRMNDVSIGFESEVIQIPFWVISSVADNVARVFIVRTGEITTSEREWMITYAAICLLSVFLVTVMLSLFTRGQWQKKEKYLVALVNRLEGKLLVSVREISSLEEQMNNVKTRPVENALSAEKREAIKDAFNKQLKQYQVKNSELEDKVTYLEKELESVSNYALEMHKLFENSLNNQSTSRAAIDEVDELRTLTEKQENEIEDLRREMEAIIIENQILKETSENTKSLLKKLQQDYNAQTKKNLELTEKQKELTFKFEKETDNNLTLEHDYKSQIYQLRSKLEEVEMKLRRSEFQVEEMNRVIAQRLHDEGSETSSDYVQHKIQLSTLEAMNNELTNQLKEEKGARRMVEDHMGAVIKELNNLKKSFEISEKERNEAITKLQVLADYFNNEKTKMHKELEAKEKLLTENESKDQLLSRTMQSLKEEVNNYKLQNEALKKEISEQEVSYKIQLAKAEQKGRDDWFAFRKIERKYKECQQEAASLRNRILILESNMSQKEDEKNGGTGMNGDSNTPPPPLGYPLLSPDVLPYPVDFIPPPPSPPLPSHSDFEPPLPLLFSPDERLPPLGGGRVPPPSNSNTSDDDEFRPPPPIPGFLSNRNRNEMSSSFMRTTSSSGRHRSSHFKPRRTRNSVDSPSSGMSMESLDKSSR